MVHVCVYVILHVVPRGTFDIDKRLLVHFMVVGYIKLCYMIYPTINIP